MGLEAQKSCSPFIVPKSISPGSASFPTRPSPGGGRDGGRQLYVSNPSGADAYWLIVHAWVVCPTPVSTPPDLMDQERVECGNGIK